MITSGDDDLLPRVYMPRWWFCPRGFLFNTSHKPRLKIKKLSPAKDAENTMAQKEDNEVPEATLETLAQILADDTKVKLAGVDIDGMLRGKLISKKKFLSVAKEGFGFCSVIFGWDMHDRTYFRELTISSKENGYRDMVAVPDLSSYRRIPWEDDVPFFLIHFFDPDTKGPICACPRGLLKTTSDKIEKEGYKAMAGGMEHIEKAFHKIY